MNFGLERIHSLLEALDRPDERTQIIHVAGTNGKGSVCAYISTVLRTCGYSVGRFNSPHLIEPRDSINVNGEPISQTLYDKAFAHVHELNTSHAIGASSFECLVGAAFYVFDQAHLDFVVLEVGLGGLLDATNAVRHPVMTIITAIGMDHAHILGHTLKEIAMAKAGIMKPGCPVVIAPQPPQEPTTNDLHYRNSDVLSTLIQHAKVTGSPCKVVEPATFVTNDPHQTREKQGEKIDIQHQSLCELEIHEDDIHYTYPIRLIGDYQRMNSATAVVALDWLKRLNKISMSTEQLTTGMKETRWPGRLEWLTEDDYPTIFSRHRIRRILVDGAHNPPATFELRKYINSLKPQLKRVIWILGCTQGKDVARMCQVLLANEDIVYTCSFTQPDGMPWIQCIPPADMIQQIKAQQQQVSHIEGFANLEDALKKAGLNCGENDLIVLCGSLYLVADLYRILL
ncbi:Mur ligase [Mycotypha africana]|uniref:Mur ligase n=1 Tax=Mycotypha africana TaxID=64632 RepID=UPI002301E8BF|nr:Mur ligase [Mycotypha africana]KAI8971784.1 Mur ligase [Mycotypha africana]